jgi:hypothetical protein
MAKATRAVRAQRSTRKVLRTEVQGADTSTPMGDHA